MDIVLSIVSQVVAQRLQQDGIRQLLSTLTSWDHDEFAAKIADILSKVSALIDISHKASTTRSLDHLLQHIIEVTTEALDAERGTLFLHDQAQGELYTKFAQGALSQEIRIAENEGIAGAVFTQGQSTIVSDAYADARFNPAVDRQTGYRTRNILCVPIKTRTHTIIGVTQLLNKTTGDFTNDDATLLEVMTSQVSEALQNAQLFDQVKRAQEEQTQLLEVATALSQELQLRPLLLKIMETTSMILAADRSTLLLYDERTNELWSLVAQGVGMDEIRFPSHTGIAGTVFTTRQTLNIPDAYADPRFNPEFDKKSGYRTRSILCMPMVDKAGQVIGVTQVLNKAGGPFTALDEKRLQAFSAQAAVAIENAKLFDDVLNMRNYNESVLQSLSNGVMTLNADHQLVKCNEAARRILDLHHDDTTEQAAAIFLRKNPWLLSLLDRVNETGRPDALMDTELVLHNGTSVSANMTIAPLVNIQQELIGSMLVVEDITREKRIRSTFGRYLSKEVVDELLSSPAGLQMGGELREVTFLVSDLRGFTSLSTRLPPQEIVSILNRYLERMVDIITHYRGTVDEFQGDGILAFFGAPLSASDDPERAVACAIDMHRALVEINADQRQRNLPEFVMGIGINTGEAIVGNIGSEKRAKYGAVGNTINTAYRIESYTIGGQILISPSTYERVRHLIRLKGTMEVEFKGLDKPMTIYEVGGLGGRYQLALPETTSQTLPPLTSPLPIACFLVQDKTVSDTAITGHITHLSAAAANVVLTAPVALHANLKIVLAPQQTSALSAIYAKVIALDAAKVDPKGIHARLEFTSLPEDAKAFLDQQ